MLIRNTKSMYVLAAALTLGVAAPASRAALIAADAFLIGGDPAVGQYTETPLATTAGGQNPVVAGFTGAWAKGNTTTSQLAPRDVPQSGPINSGYPTSGGSVLITDANEAIRLAQRTLAAYTPASTYYLSGIVRRGAADTGFNGLAYMGFGSAFPDASVASATANNYGVYWGFAGNAATETVDLVIRHRSAANTMTNQVVLAGATAGVDYTVLARLDYNVSGGQDRITYWINPTDLTSESAATASAQATGTLASFGLNVTSDLTRLTFAANSYMGGLARFDEARLATDLASIVPEPTGLALAAIVPAALLRRRRRA